MVTSQITQSQKLEPPFTKNNTTTTTTNNNSNTKVLLERIPDLNALYINIAQYKYGNQNILKIIQLINRKVMLG